MTTSAVPATGVSTGPNLRRWIRFTQWIALAGLFLSLGVIAWNVYKVYALRTEIAQLQGKRDALRQERDGLEKDVAKLKAGVAGLSYATVTPQNQVLQLKATAIALAGVRTPDGKQVYRFGIYLNAAPEILNNVSKVTYDFNHPTFKQPHREETDVNRKFLTQYVGWGCLSPVNVAVSLKGGSAEHIDFDMCKSLGPDW